MDDLIDPIELLEMARSSAPREGCAPARLASLVRHEDVAAHRSLSCADYDDCLAEVLRRGWPSWTCRLCDRFALRDAARALEIAREGSRRLELEP